MCLALHLEYLELSMTKITDNGIEKLTSSTSLIRSLQRLGARSTDISDKSVTSILGNCEIKSSTLTQLSVHQPY